MEEPSEVIDNKMANDNTTYLPERSEGKSDVVTDSQEKLNLRREARRRKILDNAKNRMEKLGVRSSNYRTHDELQNGVFEYSDPEVEPNEVRFPFNNLLDSSANTNPSEQYDPFAEEKPFKDPFIFKYRLHVLVSITVTYILALFGVMSDGNYSIMIPTCICMALEVVLRKPKPVNPITALVVTLCKLPSREANIIWRLSAILYDLVVNLGLTIFSLVTLTLIHDFIKRSSLLTLQ